MYRQELLAEQITPYTIRETPDRPLEPDEIPVRVEYRRRRWGVIALRFLIEKG